MDPAAKLAALSSLETYLDPALARDADALERIGRWLRQGRLVVVRDAFQASFAERMHRCLDQADGWQPYEKFEERFQYRHHNLYDPGSFPADLTWCRALFDGAAAKALAGDLSGRDCTGPLVFSASRYLPGDYSLPHTDAVGHDGAVRQVAFIWHLARGWRPEWGGALYWCPRDLYLAPAFNTLVLFAVGPESYHFVTPVSPYATGKRLAINGWWTGSPAAAAAPAGAAAYAGPERLVPGGPDVEAH